MILRSRERVARILSHRRADRVPLDADLPAGMAERCCDAAGVSADDREYLCTGEISYVFFRLTPDPSAFAPYLPGLPASAELTEFGVGKVALETAEGYRAGHTYYNPLAEVETVDELKRYPFPDVTKPECHAHLDDEVRRSREDGFTVVGQMSRTILETAYTMRGMTRLFVDFYDRPAYVRALFEALAERRVFQARRFAEAGVDVLRIGDDIATQSGLILGPGMYRQWLMPYHARIIAAARAVNPEIHVLYHSDGALTGLLPELIEAGVTAVNPCQPEAMRLAEDKRAYGDRLTFWGCLGTQSTYARGTHDDVRAELRMLMRDVSGGGGMILQFFNEIPTPRLEENIVEFFAAYPKLSRYS